MKLDQFLAEKNLTQPAFAEAIGVTQQAVSIWVREHSLPRRAVMRRILDFTEGKVTPNDFYSPPSSKEAAE